MRRSRNALWIPVWNFLPNRSVPRFTSCLRSKDGRTPTRVQRRRRPRRRPLWLSRRESTTASPCHFHASWRVAGDTCTYIRLEERTATHSRHANARGWSRDARACETFAIGVRTYRGRVSRDNETIRGRVAPVIPSLSDSKVTGDFVYITRDRASEQRHAPRAGVTKAVLFFCAALAVLFLRAAPVVLSFSRAAIYHEGCRSDIRRRY